MKKNLVVVVCLAALLMAWALLMGKGQSRLAVLHVKEGQCWIYQGKGGGIAIINCHSDVPPDYSARTALNVLQKWGVNRVDAFICMQTECSGYQEIAKQFPEIKLIDAGRLNDNQRILLRDSDILTVHSDDRGIYGISGREGFILLSRLPVTPLSDKPVPNVLAVGWHNSIEPEAIPDKMEADCVVLHCGKNRAQWADYGLVRHFRSASDELIQTGRDGGVIFTYKADRLFITRTQR